MGILKKLQDQNPDDQSDQSSLETDGPQGDLPPEGDENTSSASGANENRTFRRVGQRQAQTESEHREAGAAPETPAEPVSKNTEKQSRDLPPELLVLRDLLLRHDWQYASSADPDVQINGEIEWTIIEAQLHNAIEQGYEAEVYALWSECTPAGYASLDSVMDQNSGLNGDEQEQTIAIDDLPMLHPEKHQDEPQLPEAYLNFYSPERDPAGPSTGRVFDYDSFFEADPGSGGLVKSSRPFSDPYESPQWGRPRPIQEPPKREDDDEPQAKQTASGLGGLIGAAGSMVLGSLKAVGNAAKTLYAKNRIYGYEQMGKQLVGQAQNIESMTQGLKAMGMDALIADMKASGYPANELMQGMNKGGSHQNFGDSFDALMDSAEFAAQYQALQRAMTDFSLSATRYASAGVELNRDVSPVLDFSLEKITAATEGFIFRKDGKIEHMQELARQIGERIANFLNNVFGRLAPQ